MQFNVGDFIVHPAYGVGQIIEIEEKQFTELEAECYYKISLPQRTLWLPIEAESSIGLRLVTAKSDLARYRKLLKSPPVPLNKNHQQRHLELTNRLKEGSFRVMCEVVRDLTARGWHKPLSQRDTATLKKTRESLLEEWSRAAGVSKAEAVKEVESLLQATQQAYGG